MREARTIGADGPHQRCHAAHVFRVDRCAGLQQHLDDVGITSGDRGMQRRQAAERHGTMPSREARSAETTARSGLRASSAATSMAFPFTAALISAVDDSPVRALACASAPCASGIVATSRLSTFAAAMSAVTPVVSEALTFAALDEQQSDDVPAVVRSGGDDERGPAQLRDRVHIGARVEQHRVFPMSVTAQCSAVTPAGLAASHVGAASNQGPDGLSAAKRGSEHQRGLALRPFRVDPLFANE